MARAFLFRGNGQLVRAAVSELGPLSHRTRKAHHSQGEILVVSSWAAGHIRWTAPSRRGWRLHLFSAMRKYSRDSSFFAFVCWRTTASPGGLAGGRASGGAKNPLLVSAERFAGSTDSRFGKTVLGHLRDRGSRLTGAAQDQKAPPLISRWWSEREGARAPAQRSQRGRE